MTRKNTLRLYEEINFLKQQVKKLEENSSTQTLIENLFQLIGLKDPHTTGHQKRTADLARTIAKEMGFPAEAVEGIHLAGTIHDLGKFLIPMEILNKPCALTTSEMTLVRNHPGLGYDMAKKIKAPYPIPEIIWQHHERLDGSGYPQGLKGDQILRESRIIAVADVVEAMASHRPYRPSPGMDKALAEIENNKGMLYDPEVVNTCTKLFQEKRFAFGY